MEQIIAFIIFVTSFLGMVFLFLKKIPVLVSLPEEKLESSTRKFLKRTKEKIKEIKIFQKSFWDFLLEKNLRKIRILTLKIDSKIFNWLKKKKEQELKKKKQKESFWDKIKKEIK